MSLQDTIAELKKQITKLEEESISAMGKRVVLAFDFDDVTDIDLSAVPPRQVTRTYTIDKDKRFYIKSMEAAININGTIPGGNQIDATINPLTLGEGLQFVWKGRDSGSDREWSNDWLPLQIMNGFNIQGNKAGRSHIFLSPTSDIQLTVGMTYLDTSIFSELIFSSISSITVYVTLIGFTEPA